MKERRTYLINEFLGIDFTTSPLKVDSRHGVSGVNFITEYGQLAKRNGWLEQIKFAGKIIYGIYHYINGEDEFLLVRASDKIYKVDMDFSAYTTLYTLAVATNEKIAFYPLDDKVYITGLGVYLVFYYKTDAYVIEVVEHTSNAYVPTTTISIDAKSVADPYRDVLERPNILTRFRKNSLKGNTNLTNEWILDGVIKDDGLYVVPDPPAAYWQWTQVYVDVEVLESGELVTYRYLNNPDSLTASHELWDETLTALCGEIRFKVKDNIIAESSIYLNTTTTPPIEGADNITVTFESVTLDELADLKANRIGTIYGVNGQSNQLFLAYKSKEFYSKAYDFSYFPDDQYNYVGNKKNDIVGYQRMSDTSLVIYKGNLINESRIYFRIMDLYTNEATVTAGYRIVDRSVDVNIGCDAPGSIANLAGDMLFLSLDGVYAVTLGDNVSVESRHVKERSAYINKHIKTKGMASAKAIVWNNRYYLAVEGSVYVADARYRTAASMNDTFNYEWFYWENIDVTSWIVIDNELYFGTSAGRICKFDDTYSDRTLIKASQGDVTLVVEGNYLVYNQTIPVEENDHIMVSCYEVLIPRSVMTVDGYGLITISYDVEAVLEEGMTIYIMNAASGLTEGTPYTVSDLAYTTFKLKNAALAYVYPTEAFDVLRDLSAVDMLTTNVDLVNSKFQLKRYTAGSAVVLASYTTAPITFVITIHDPVIMVWYSPIMDLGTNLYTKTLFGLTISADASTEGEIQFGYDTRNISSNIQSLNFTVFDFDDIDFNNFTFLTAIASSFTKQIKEKDFNFIILKVGSETPTSAIINSITLQYKINNINRGIR